MKSFQLLIIILFCFFFHAKADRIFLMNSTGFQMATPAIITAITSNGHTVVQNATGVYTLPAGFVSTCVDSVNGYDWLCFFGNNVYSGLLPQIQAFIDDGGKVFYQYEVGCCTNASSSAAAIASGLTGLTITPNANSAMATGTPPGWIASNVSCCGTFQGTAYKGLDGLPLANQLLATANLNSSAPSIALCPNFGFVFATNDFIGTAHKGGIIGLGDYNCWFNGGPANIGPIYMPLVNFIFPNDTSTCFIFPPGCLQTYFGQGSSTIALNLGNDTTLCPGQTLLLNATNGAATYVWQDGSTNATFNVTTSGTYWVKVTTNCSFAIDTIQINYITAQGINLGNDTTICQGQSVNLNVTTPGATYLWQNGSTNATFNAAQTGTYWVQITTNCGVVSDTMNMNVAPSPVVNIGNDTTLCQGQTLTLNAGNTGATFLWQNGSVNATFNATQTGTYWVIVNNGCSVTDSIHIAFSPLPVVDFGQDKFLCFGETLTLDATTTGALYLWQNGSTNPTFFVTVSGNYWVELTLNNCKARDTVLVTIAPPIFVDLGSPLTRCKGDTVMLNAGNAGANYAWQDNSSNQTFIAMQSGLYWVQVSVNNCVASDSVFLTFNDNPIVNLGPDISLCPGETLLLNATTPNATYLWQDNSVNATYLVTQAGSYQAQVTVNNCIGSDEINIDYLKPNCVCTVFLPNAFSPNNDLKNDVFNLINTNDITLKEFRIFNRWGNEVFRTQNLHDSWNGNYKGEPAEIGTYFYYVTYTCGYSGKEMLLKGDITLVR